MRLTKKNSQKRQNYYRHNKKSQKRHMKGGDGAPPVPTSQRPPVPTAPRPRLSQRPPISTTPIQNEQKNLTFIAPEPTRPTTTDNVKELNSVSGNSANYLKKTKFEMRLGSGKFGIVQKRCRKKLFREEKCYAVKTLIIEGKIDNEDYIKLLKDLTREVKIQRELTMNGKKKIGDKNYIAQYLSHSIKTAVDQDGPYKIGPYLAMSFYEKGGLNNLGHFDGKELYEKSGDKIKKFIKQLCEGLKYMNKENISHNDIAARNVLIAKVGEEYQPRITDFGLAQEIPNGISTKKIYTTYPTLESAPEIFESINIHINSDVYSAAILLSNIIFNYRYFHNLKKGEDYEWKNLLKQAPFNKYPKPFSISNIKKMYRKIGNKEDNLTKHQLYVDLIINDRYLNEDYSDNSIIATIFEDNTFRKAKCFRYDVTQRSNMEELCELFNNKIPELNQKVFNYLNDERFADDASPVPMPDDVPEAEAKAEAKAEAEAEARPEPARLEPARPEAEAEAEAGAGAGAEAKAEAAAEAEAGAGAAAEAVAEAGAASSLRRRRAMREETELKKKAAAAKERAGAQTKPPPIIQEPLSADPSNIAPNLVANVRKRAAAEAAEAAEARAAPEGEKTVANLITLMENKNNHTKFPDIFSEFRKKNKSTQINKKKYKKYEKSYTGLGGIKKLRRHRLKKILSNLQEPNNNNNNNNNNNATSPAASSTAGGARTNKKKINKKYSKKNKKNYTINKKRTHKRK